MCPRPVPRLLAAYLALLAWQHACGQPPAKQVGRALPAKAVRTDRYGDPLPEGAVARLGTARLRPGIADAPFALSPDGKTLATGEPGKVRLWELSTGKEVRSFELAGATHVYTIHFSRDGKLFAAIGDQRALISHPSWEDHDLYVGHVASGMILYRFKEDRKGFSSVAFSADGKALAARRGGNLFSLGPPGGVLLWDTATGKELRRFPEALCYVLSPDSKSIATGGKDGTVRLWDMGSGREVGRFKGHRDPVNVLAFSPDGKVLASASGQDPDRPPDAEKKGVESDNTVRLWDVAARTEACRCKGHECPVSSVQFSPDGRVFVSADGDRNLFLWETATGNLRQRFRGDRDRLDAFAFAPDSRTLVWGQEDGVVHEWDIRRGKERRRWEGDGGRVAGFEFSPDGRTTVSGGEHLHVWDVTAGKEGRPLEGHRSALRSLAFTPDGRFLATADEGHSLRLWEAATGKSILLSGRRQHRVRRLGLSEDGRTLSAVGFDLNCRVWEVATGRKVCQFQVGTAATVRHWEKVTDYDKGSFDRVEMGPHQCLLFGPGNHVLAVVGEDQHIQLWETATGRKLARLEAHQGQGAWLDFSPDGKFFASLDSDLTLHLWELPGGRELRRFPAEGDGAVGFAFSPDGRVLAWISQGKVRLWDLSAGRAMGRQAGHPTGIECAAFDRDGKTLVSGGRDQTVRVWDTVTGTELRRITGEKYELTHIELLPHADGRVLALLAMDPGYSRYSLREAITGRQICAKMGWAEKFAVSHDGKTLALGMTTIQLRETATGSALPPLPEGHRGRVTALAFSPDGRTLASGGSDGTVLIWDWPRNCRLVRQTGKRWGRQQLEPLWAELASEDAAAAYRAIGVLAADGEDAVALLRERVKPANERDWEPVQRLLADLNSDQFSVRERACRELRRLTAESEPVLRRVLTGRPPLEVRRRVEALLSAPQLTRWSPEMLRRLRAVQALEQIGTPAAREVLQLLAEGLPEDRLTQEAKASLRRLDRRPVANRRTSAVPR